MNIRVSQLAAEILAAVASQRVPPTAVGRLFSLAAIKVESERLLEVLASDADSAEKEKELAVFLDLASVVEEVFGKGSRYVKVWRAMHAIAKAELDGGPQPTDEELGLTSKCFVATACYESAECSQVRQLRRFRDDVLLKSPFGRLLVSLYYRISPPLAHWLTSRPRCRNVVRKCLIEPLVRILFNVH
ncbi:MAG: hypothetical protein HQ592_13055 [Planctomycetes bacterium]|nr:hypothetical protein [Planctomycetota bacterium]